MSKLRLTCVDCGFEGFVDSPAQAALARWVVVPTDPPTARCPACADAAREHESARVAGLESDRRASHSH